MLYPWRRSARGGGVVSLRGDACDPPLTAAFTKRLLVDLPQQYRLSIAGIAFCYFVI